MKREGNRKVFLSFFMGDGKMKITVLAGGNSPEREVSLASGSLIANALIGNGHRVLLLDLRKGLPELPEDPEALFGRESVPIHPVGAETPDPERSGGDPDGRQIGENVLAACRAADVVFLALHGGIGENGRLQAVLDCAGVPYTGSDAVGSQLAMDKDLAKRLLRDARVPTPDWMRFDSETDSVAELLGAVGLPCVVKPIDGGSSVGVRFARNEEDLREAVGEAARYGRYVLVEREIKGRELTVGILGERVLPAVEIRPRDGFYNYRNKYNGTTEEICPADLPEPIRSRLEIYARRAFRALRLRGYARFDFLLDGAGRLWCLEANTLPGMTPTSLFPREAAAVGISFPALCETILCLAKDTDPDAEYQ